MADVTINELTGQAPTNTDVFPFSTTGVTPSTYKATLLQIKTALAIPAAQIQSDWNQASSASLDFIKNKPTIPTVPKIAWARFNGSGTIQASSGITSITNNPSSLGTWLYRIDVTAAGFSNANYSVVGMTRYNNYSNFMQLYTGGGETTTYNPTQTVFYVGTNNDQGGGTNTHINYIQVIGN